jgi:FkbM family methyltransferase
MTLGQLLREGLKKMLCSRGFLQFGSSLYDDVATQLPNERISLIFDVGANNGQSAVDFRRKFPTATVHCFEPNPDCCQVLMKLNLGLKIHQTALGRVSGFAGFNRSAGGSDMFRLSDDTSKETVCVDTVDGFCSRSAIDRIGLLKIDTEGHDLEVILGAKTMLDDRNIDVVQAEVSMNSANTFHASFFDVHTHMESLGYRLFGIYEQMFEWPTNEPHMRRANVVYISPTVIEANRRRS